MVTAQLISGFGFTTYMVQSLYLLNPKSLPKQAHAAIFKAVKMIFLDKKKEDIFLIFAQNIDCGYTLEQPH